MARPSDQFTAEDGELRDQLVSGDTVEPKQEPERTPLEERVIAGFEEIQRFVRQAGRAPSTAEGGDIFERLHAVRLEQIRRRSECRAALEGLDPLGLLDGDAAAQQRLEALSDDALLAELGVDAAAAAADDDDIATLRHVKSQAEKKAAEDIADRKVCKDFDAFKPLFDAVRRDLASGVRETRQFRREAGFLKADIKKGEFFILGGQTAYIAEVGAFFTASTGHQDARLRVIFANATESDLLLRSLQRALYRDQVSRRISDPSLAGPLFSNAGVEAEDASSGVIYVLRSLSNDPKLKERRDVLHKIGVTGDSVEKRIANAARDATFLLAEVEIVATYELFNVNRAKLERVIHRFFEPARLDVQITDRFGQPVVPREWFLVPLPAIDEAVERIKNGDIGAYVYDPSQAALVRRPA